MKFSFRKNIVGIVAVTSVLFAADVSKNVMTLVVAGNRLDSGSQYLYNKSADTRTYTQEDLNESKKASVPKFLSETSGFQLDYMGIGNKYTLSSRGYSSKPGVVVMVDGVKQNDINNDSVLWDSIPMESIERIDVIKGGNSVIFGAGAVGGVINIITKKPTNKIETNLFLEAGDYDRFKKVVFVSFPAKVVPLFFSAYYSDLKDGGYRENSGFNNENKQLVASYKPIRNLELRYIYKDSRAKSLMPGPLTFDEFTNNPRMATANYEAKDFYLEGNKENQYRVDYTSEIFNFVTTVYDRKRNQHSQLDGTSGGFGWGTYVTADMQKTGIVSQLEVPLNIFSFKNNVIIGYENSEDTIANKGSGSNTANLKAKTDSYFISNQTFFGDIAIVDLGYRVDDINYDYSNIVVGYGSVFPWPEIYKTGTKKFKGESPAIGVTFLPYEALNFYANYNKSFKVMPLEDFAVFNPSYNANASIDAQTNDSIEAGVKWEVFNGFDVYANTYVSEVKDEILYNDATMYRKNQNFDTLHTGFAVGVKYLFLDNFIFKASYEKDEAKLKSSAPSGTNMVTDNAVPNIPSFVVNASIEYLLDDSVSVMLKAKNTGSYFPINDFEGKGSKVGPYIVYDLIANYKINNIGLFFKVENLTDLNFALYSAYGVGTGNQNYYPANGRTIRFGAEIDL